MKSSPGCAARRPTRAETRILVDSKVIIDEYRRRGGNRTSPLPDFHLDAPAAVSGPTLLTRDARRSAGYFPKVRLMAP
jgi:hypothetical protein